MIGTVGCSEAQQAEATSADRRALTFPELIPSRQSTTLEGSYSELEWNRLLGLRGVEVEIAGFMLPVQTVDGRVSEFLVLSFDPTCCFGRAPKAFEYVWVRCTEPVRYLPKSWVVAAGTFEIESPEVDKGQAPAVFRLERGSIERYAAPPDSVLHDPKNH